MKGRCMELCNGKSTGWEGMIRLKSESESHPRPYEWAGLTIRRPRGGQDVDHLGLLGTSGMLIFPLASCCLDVLLTQ